MIERTEGEEPAERARELAERVREELVEAALAGWEEAAIAGVCGEGAFEVAVGRMRGVDLGAVVAGLSSGR